MKERKRRIREKLQKQPQNKFLKMAINIYVSIIPLKINGLNEPIKRHNNKMTEWIPTRPIYMLSIHFNLKTSGKKKKKGIPGWLSGLAPAFVPGRNPGVPGSSPASGSQHGACFSL